jgi:galactose mutarotase-like enzyme
MQLLYHINFGMPLVAPGTTFHIPFAEVAPRTESAAGFLDKRDVYLPERIDAPEQCFFYEPVASPDGWTLAVLKNESLGKGLSLRFNKNQLPFFTQWKNHQPDSDGYVTGLEPGLNFPNTRSFEKEHGRVLVLEPGESRSFEIELIIHDSSSAVNAAIAEVDSLQSGVAPRIQPDPKPDWSE